MNPRHRIARARRGWIAVAAVAVAGLAAGGAQSAATHHRAAASAHVRVAPVVAPPDQLDRLAAARTARAQQLGDPPSRPVPPDQADRLAGR